MMMLQSAANPNSNGASSLGGICNKQLFSEKLHHLSKNMSTSSPIDNLKVEDELDHGVLLDLSRKQKETAKLVEVQGGEKNTNELRSKHGRSYKLCLLIPIITV